MPRTIVQLVLINETGDSYYRMRWPARDLCLQHSDWRVISLDARALERFTWGEHADLLILYQSSDIDLIPLIELRRKKGLKTLVEYNDNFYDPAAWSPVAKPWSSPLLWQTYEALMNAGDALLVTGDGLEQLFAPHARVPIHILRNHFPLPLPPFEQLWQEPTDEIRIGWAGSLGHMADILTVAPLFRRLVADYSRVRIHLMGNNTIPELFGVPQEKLRFTDWGSMEHYFQFWRPVHIGIAPLLDTAYNRCRSDVKAIEIASSGTLPILQRALPYADFIAETATPSFADMNELEKQLRHYIENRDVIQETARRSYDYVATKRIGPRQTERGDLYTEFLPKDPPAFSWPMQPGYYEVAGTPESGTRSFTLLAEVQNRWNRGAKQEAYSLITQAMQQNPGNSDWAIADYKCSLQLNPSGAESKLNIYAERFPRDLRFPLSRISGETSAGIRLTLWEALWKKVKALDKPARDFFRLEVLKHLKKELRRPHQFLKIGEAFREIYDESPEIHLMLAEAYERTGDDAQAFKHYTWLLRAQSGYELSKEFFAAFEGGYIPAWCSTLEARLAQEGTAPQPPRKRRKPGKKTTSITRR